MAAFKSLLALVALLLAVGAVDAHKPPKPAADSVAAFVIANKNKGFGILLEAVLAADASIVETLSKPDLVATVFAPDGTQFDALKPPKPAADSVAAFVIANKNKGFGILLEAVLAADASVVETLSKPDLVATVFAPDDNAFRVLLKDLQLTKEELLANKDLLIAVLSYHVIGAKVTKKDLKELQVVQTLLAGETGELKIIKAWEHKGRHWVQNVRLETTSGSKSLVKAADVIVGKNGAAVIHAVNRVLIPGDKFFK
ncbi:fasciclin [Micractinium conductrix]|uniref:Fasciclin n=1 Tax=Micractinium conductrix TaxID=554055 RepID=A0A2P6VRD8_9CHLO|nr:fasciclin [Micractinium conductrix]|eukprot:PSC76641.1 fasciclin [Micractinium conductrix]